MRCRLLVLSLLAAGGLTACGSDDEPPVPGPPPVAEAPAADTGAPAARGDVRTLATGLQVPWGVAFLPNGDGLVSERTTARILRIPKDGGRPTVVMRVPGVDTGAGEGGLLGIAVSRNYRRDRLVYAYLTSRSDNRIVRFKLGGKVRTVFSQITREQIHNGGRLAFGPDGKLYAGVGDAGDTELSQTIASPNGKILRMNPDGSVPSDNPFRGSRVWSRGHRNPQGLTFDRQGRLWAVEFGQNRVDEVNLIRRGANYGWPIVEGKGSTQGGKFVNPKVTWPTSEASPSGVAFADGALYVGALRGERVYRVALNGARTGATSSLIRGRYGRLRTVQRAPDGTLWVTTSNRDGRGSPRSGDDRVLRLQP